MKVRSDKPFAHRVIAGGMIESICMSCFLTVCRCRTEAESEEQEAAHICEDDPNPASFLFL
jgi:hypothetical protein